MGMNNSELFGIYEPDPRYLKLVDKYHEYCSQSEYLDNRSALQLHKEFVKWCDENGYSRSERNAIKRKHPYRFRDDIRHQ